VPETTGLVTTAPAPIVLFEPTSKYCKTCAPVPTSTFSPRVTPPEIFTVGFRVVDQSITDS